MASRLKTLRLTLLVVFALPIAARAGLYAVADHPRSWRDANWSTTGLLPPATDDPPARVLVFAARAGGWRSIFAVHTWIVVKPANAPSYTRYDVMGFGQPVRINLHAPDAFWFSGAPRLVADIRGDDAARAIPAIQAAVKSYPYADYGSYRVWPGPNSNTFTAYVARQVPELQLELPSNAIGKDYLPEGALFAAAPSATGYQLSLFGLLGVMVARDEGFELNLLGFDIGFALKSPALKLPGIGRVGMSPSAGPVT